MGVPMRQRKKDIPKSKSERSDSQTVPNERIAVGISIKKQITIPFELLTHNK